MWLVHIASIQASCQPRYSAPCARCPPATSALVSALYTHAAPARAAPTRAQKERRSSTRPCAVQPALLRPAAEGAKDAMTRGFALDFVRAAAEAAGLQDEVYTPASRLISFFWRSGARRSKWGGEGRYAPGPLSPSKI